MRTVVAGCLAVVLAGCAGSRGPGSAVPAVTEAEARAIDTYGLGAASLAMSERPAAADMDVALTPPPAPAAEAWAAIGASVQGRPIMAATVPGRLGGGGRLLVIGSIHGTEREGLGVIDRLVDHLRTEPVGASVRVIRDMNPDGSAARTRGNARGVDLNRNWPAASFVAGAERGDRPLSEPETLAVMREIERWRPTLVLVLHSTPSGPYANYDGPGVDAATRFAGAASAHDPRWRVVADMGYPTPGSLGSMVGDDAGVPILTVEFDRGQDGEGVWGALRDGVRAVAR